MFPIDDGFLCKFRSRCLPVIDRWRILGKSMSVWRRHEWLMAKAQGVMWESDIQSDRLVVNSHRDDEQWHRGSVWYELFPTLSPQICLLSLAYNPNTRLHFSKVTDHNCAQILLVWKENVDASSSRAKQCDKNSPERQPLPQKRNIMTANFKIRLIIVDVRMSTP